MLTDDTNHVACIQCQAPFDPPSGTPVGQYTVCSPRCAAALLNRAERDHPGMRQDDAIRKLLAEIQDPHK